MKSTWVKYSWVGSSGTNRLWKSSRIQVILIILYLYIKSHTQKTPTNQFTVATYFWKINCLWKFKVLTFWCAAVHAKSAFNFCYRNLINNNLRIKTTLVKIQKLLVLVITQRYKEIIHGNYFCIPLSYVVFMVQKYVNFLINMD